MLDRDQMTPEEIQEHNQPLIQDLLRYYNTRAEDNASLARIHARLLQKTAASLPVTEDSEVAQPSLLLQSRPQRNTKMKFVPAFAKDRPRYPYLTTLVAATLLVVLVGSFVLIFHLRQGTTASPTVEHGWSLVAQFSGTGNKTISGQNIEVGHKFGWLLTCTGTQDSFVDVKFNGGNASGSGSGSCSVSKTGPLGPEADVTSPVVMESIHTIQVTTAASISWELLLFKGTYYPPMSIDAANWRALQSEMDGTGNGTWGIDVTLPRTWAMQFVCHGTGNIQISLQSGYPPNALVSVGGVNTPCNGQITFNLFDLVGQGMKISQVQITTSADNDWQVLLVSCTNGKPHCGITTVTPTPTP